MAEYEPRKGVERDELPNTRRRPGQRSDDASAASEPMDLQRLPEPKKPPPPGRQRTGDPPAR